MGTPITRDVQVPVYRYQQALDLYASIKPDLNVSDEQYDMHVDAIKKEGIDYKKTVTEVLQEWPYDDAPEGYEEFILELPAPDAQQVWFGYKMPEVANYAPGKTIKMFLPEKYKQTTAMNFLMYGKSSIVPGKIIYGSVGPQIFAAEPTTEVVDGGIICTGTTVENVAVESGFGTYVLGYFDTKDGSAITEEDLENLKKDFRLYIDSTPQLAYRAYTCEVDGETIYAYHKLGTSDVYTKTLSDISGWTKVTSSMELSKNAQPVYNADTDTISIQGTEYTMSPSPDNDLYE